MNTKPRHHRHSCHLDAGRGMRRRRVHADFTGPRLARRPHRPPRGRKPGTPALSISEYLYKGETVYFVPQRCGDVFRELYDDGGNLIAHPDSGIAGSGDGRAPDFIETGLFVRTVWTDARNVGGRKLVPAPIDEVEVLILESFPPQYRVRMVSGLPNGCALFDHWELQRDLSAGEFTIAVLNTVPTSDVACIEIYGTVEHSISLGEGIEPGATYAVRVNDRVTAFDAQ